MERQLGKKQYPDSNSGNPEEVTRCSLPSYRSEPRSCNSVHTLKCCEPSCFHLGLTGPSPHPAFARGTCGISAKARNSP
eukprot:4372662-Amphidinium_carterae.1